MSSVCLTQVTQLTGFSDPVYAEAYVHVNQYDIVLDVLVVNQTSDTLQNCTLELATLGQCSLFCSSPHSMVLCFSQVMLIQQSTFSKFTKCIPPIGDLKLVEKPSPLTLAPHDFANIKANVKVASTENGIIFGNIGKRFIFIAEYLMICITLVLGCVFSFFEICDPVFPVYDVSGAASDRNCVVLSDIHIDIMDYIQPASCTDAEFRQMWAEFEWENKVRFP